MHCDACSSLIKMELEDASLISAVKEINILGDNKGEIIFNEDTPSEDITKISDIINTMDNYNIV